MSAVTDDWVHLIGDVSDITERCALVETRVGDGLSFKAGGRVLFHPHCHQRALWGSHDRARTAARPGVEIEIPTPGCCGMAGAFGYRADRYELSVAMGERVLAPAVRSTDADIVATGTSCRHQIGDLTSRHALHPVEFLATALGLMEVTIRRGRTCEAEPLADLHLDTALHAYGAIFPPEAPVPVREDLAATWLGRSR